MNFPPAETITPFASGLGLRILDPPFDAPGFDLHLVSIVQGPNRLGAPRGAVATLADQPRVARGEVVDIADLKLERPPLAIQQPATTEAA